MGLFSTQDRHEFKPLLVELEERPANPLAHWLLAVIVAFLVLGGLWLYFARIDIVVSAQGKVIPDGEIKIVQPIETGVISKILVREGDLVENGQVLMEIDPSVTETNLESKAEHLELLELECARLEALAAETAMRVPKNVANETLIATQRSLYESARGEHEEQLHVLQNQLEQAQSQQSALEGERARLEKMLEGASAKEQRLKSVLDIIARTTYEEARDARLNYEEQIGIKTHEINQNSARITEVEKQKALYLQQHQKELLETLSQKRNEAQTLKAEIEAILFQKSKQYITAPVAGYIGQLFVHTEGGVVSPAEKLVSIIPADTPLLLKVNVRNQDIGFIKKQMHTAIKIDTFTYQKYGLLQGEVAHVSDDAIEDEKLGLVYEVFVKPEQTYLEHNNEHYDLHIGMSVQAEMKVGTRRVIEFFIYPAIRYLDEGLSVR